jgi:hypothetical protein
MTIQARVLLCLLVVPPWLPPRYVDAEDLPSESSCLVIARNAGGTVHSVPLSSLHVLESTSHAGKFALPPDAPAGPTGLLCGRSSLIPAPNDYKVLLAGLTLGISKNDEPNARLGVLELVSGKLQFRMIDGVLTVEEMKMLQPRLDALQLKVDNPT